MVNTGQPSAGCEACRARRIRCDENKPNCMRCQNSKRQCPGYRDLSKVRFGGKPTSKSGTHSPAYDQKYRETSEAVDIAPSGPWQEDVQEESPMAVRRMLDSMNSSLRCQNNHSEFAVPSNNLVAMHLRIPDDEAAQCFFLTNYIMLPGTTIKMGQLNFIVPMLQAAAPHSPLRLAFTAVSMAALGSQPNSRALLPKARLDYVRALNQITTALADPKQAKGNPVIATSLLLTVYEAIIKPNADLTGWHSHVEGAVALISSGRRRLFRSEISRELFLSIRELMTIENIGTSKAPNRGVYWWINRVPEEETSERYALLNLHVSQLRAENNKITTLSPQDPRNAQIVTEFLKRAEELEKQYRDWYEGQASSWGPMTAAWVERDDTIDFGRAEAFPGRIETYSDLLAAYRYNVARSSQIFIWTSILRAVAWLGYPEDYRITANYSNARHRCIELIEGIIASIPYFLGWKDSTRENFQGVAHSACGESKRLTGVSSLFIAWPIFVAATSDFATRDQRTFVKGRLTYIAQERGLGHAEQLIQYIPIQHPSVYIVADSMAPLKIEGSSTTIGTRSIAAFDCPVSG